MDDLFRFLLLRPADLPSADELKVLEPSFLDDDDGGGEDGRGEVAHKQHVGDPRRAAEEYLASERALHRVEDLAYAEMAFLVYNALLAGPLTLADLTALVAETTETPVGEIVASNAFVEDAQRLADTLVATKIVSG